MQQQTCLVCGERQVFENEQQSDVKCDAAGEPAALRDAGTAACLSDVQTYEPSDKDGKNHEEDEDGFAPGVEYETHEEQEAVTKCP